MPRRWIKTNLSLGCAILGAVSVIVGSYGHAALSTDLLLEGSATVGARNDFDITYMQEMTPEICNSVGILATGQLIDERDNKTYWVTKLPDGQCWMVQNLDYDGGGTKFFTKGNLERWIDESGAVPAQYAYTNDNDKGLESDGSYYTYAASLSVCPAGWRLPISGEDGDYAGLFDDWSGTVAQKVARAQQAPYYIRLVGGISSGGIVRKGVEVGLRAMRTPGDSRLYSGYFNLSANRFEVNTEDWFGWGVPVRCIAGEQPEEPKDLISTSQMQNLTTEICANTTIGTARIMSDARDNHKYWITRLKDGNCWMTQNLDYDGGGVKYVEGGSLAKWPDTSANRSYYYRGDWEKGRQSYGSLYSGKAAQAVCPAGWRLPSGGTSGEYAVLWSGLGSGTTLRNAIMAGPYYFVRAGNITPDTRGLIGEGTEIVMWTSTATAKGYYSAYSGSSNTTAAADDVAGFGAAVRCLVSGD